MINARVTVFLKNDVMDPQGVAVGQALESLGHKTVESVRVGRAFNVEINSNNIVEAEQEVEKMCESLLANTVIENYEYTLELLEGSAR